MLTPFPVEYFLSKTAENAESAEEEEERKSLTIPIPNDQFPNLYSHSNCSFPSHQNGIISNVGR
ncbi:hypothetical protein NIES267_18410 [Calothrix parasitica NIES-267]|uniref:Uncharacterized protein n=1 Tax=Calothrix parasitica NIES-267 TaxID=1973488 RepID=A0A1Z4LMA3_9CYAN|nr:hypothetical protein NIES267_18410 [Calothrix parasitica NIES-267]